MYAIRGAITINENTCEEIKTASIQLIESIILSNNLNKNDIISIMFSCTQDITKDYPGKYVREHFMLDKVAIMHFNEMHVENSLKLCIRVMLQVHGNKSNINYIYLGDAKNLRKDLLTKTK